MRKSTIRKFIVENFLFGEETKLHDSSDLFRESIIDSTGTLELIAFIETTYGIHVEDHEMVQENFHTISAINNYLETKTIHQNL